MEVVIKTETKYENRKQSEPGRLNHLLSFIMDTYAYVPLLFSGSAREVDPGSLKLQNDAAEVPRGVLTGSVKYQYKYVTRRRCKNTSTVTPTHSSWFGTPSAMGNCAEVDSSSGTLEEGGGLLIGAGVTGRLGRSCSLGKSVNRIPDTAPAVRWFAGPSQPPITWTLALLGGAMD